MAACHSALAKIKNENLDSTEIRTELARLLSDQRPGGRILEDNAVLPPRIEAAKLLAKRIEYPPLVSKSPLAITDEDVTNLQKWIEANPKKLLKDNQ